MELSGKVDDKNIFWGPDADGWIVQNCKIKGCGKAEVMIFNRKEFNIHEAINNFVESGFGQQECGHTLNQIIFR